MKFLFIPALLLAQAVIPASTNTHVDGARLAEAPGDVGRQEYILPAGSHTPNPASSVHVYRNGLRLDQGTDYVVTGTMIIFLPGVSIPRVGDILVCDYRY